MKVQRMSRLGKDKCNYYSVHCSKSELPQPSWSWSHEFSVEQEKDLYKAICKNQHTGAAKLPTNS